jgi:chemotaxis protein histidine kinase CheA
LEQQKKGQTMATYRRPHFQGSIENPPRGADGNIPAESLGEMLGRVSENSMGEIDNLVGEFQRLREKLRTDGERIQREIEQYTELSQMVMQLTKTISEGVEKVRAFGGSTAH